MDAFWIVLIDHAVHIRIPFMRFHSPVFRKERFHRGVIITDIVLLWILIEGQSVCKLDVCDLVLEAVFLDSHWICHRITDLIEERVVEGGIKCFRPFLLLLLDPGDLLVGGIGHCTVQNFDV